MRSANLNQETTPPNNGKRPLIMGGAQPVADTTTFMASDVDQL